MITEYAGGSNLSEYLELKPTQTVDELEARNLIGQLLRCLSYCHQKGIAHNNLSMNNVFILEDFDSEDLDREDEEPGHVKRYIQNVTF